MELQTEALTFTREEFRNSMIDFNHFSGTQKSELKLRFVIDLTNRITALHSDLSEKEIRGRVRKYTKKVYTMLNFEMMHMHDNHDTFTYKNLGFTNTIWIECLIDYITEISVRNISADQM